ncbi:gliding motility-associated ABC transporter ATP-binding subunit GldA [Dawidia soli]|uniref:Gliding motility-associated ABC transporter ATP-binding subunit GldA n=1 Tax=Dawidia soli TaxID=2782352 RepID=A0AAP2D5Q0_9BACT|nr:gliding motility-associated ABC transporter ATP-binding subunit GldA [Dawidia soli]MBT1685846.1 gliding motility-associated ABC transporter ATP-binding subunit GldA [Dawidia soli]
MSLQIKNLTKQYGQQKAVDGISFAVGEGEIVGFLGPNGAGKSTTMKIATCFLPPTTGHVRVAGHDVVEAPLQVKKITGYLPEHNPLYLDMFVHEYLHFVGKLYGMRGNTLRHAVGAMIERCGLTREQNKKIETLSKGYRQRVGLAQALIHNPRVLILDEPTSGLDPNQLVEIRKLIKDVSRDKTVLFSTHIMQEVEALCDRVIVINKGVIVADDRLENLLRRSGGQRVVIAEFAGGVTAEQLRTLPGVTDVRSLEGGRFALTSADADVRPEIFRFAADHSLSLIGLQQEENSLETIFHALTAAGATPNAEK